MNASFFAGPTVLGLALVSALIWGESAPNNNAAAAITWRLPASPSTAQAEAVSPPLFPLMPESFGDPGRFTLVPPQAGTLLSTNARQPQPNLKLFSPKRFSPRSGLGTASGRRGLAPGIYKTAPYTLIVVVPRTHPDDKCVVNPGPGGPTIPTVKPDLRFIPLGSR